MESVLRGVATYLFVWLVFRVAGKRTLAQITTFDAVLLLIVSETTQAALTDNDSSMTNSFVLILTILGMDIIFSLLKQRFHLFERVVDGAAVVLFDQKGLDNQTMTKERVDEQDILQAARSHRGLPNLEEVEYAILEQSGGITVVPKKRES